jgi:hypothetical protein
MVTDRPMTIDIGRSVSDIDNNNNNIHLFGVVTANRQKAEMNIFGNSETLPVHGGSRRSNGITGMPVIDKGVSDSIGLLFFVS